MKSLKFTLTLAFLVGFLVSVTAQNSTALLKRGDNAFNDGEYYTAIQYYLQVNNDTSGVGSLIFPYSTRNTAYKVSKDVDVFAHTTERLAESYRKIFDYENAEKWYAKTIALKNGSAKPEVFYWYATCLRSNAKYDEALIQFRKFKETGSSDAGLNATVDKEIKGCEIGSESMKYPQPVNLVHLTSSDLNNEKSSNYASFFDTGDTTAFYYTTTRYTAPGGNKKEQPYMNKVVLYYSGGFLSPVHFYNSETYANAHMGTPSLTHDGKRMYITLWNFTDPVNKFCKIYFSYKLNDTSWSDLLDVGAKVNAEGSYNREPFVSPDGTTLYFSSNRTGGQGAYDLYKVTLNSDGAANGEAQNLGSTINSVGDEFAPYFLQDRGTLYFSSNGHPGMGGIDIYSSEWKNNSWTTPENLRYPINSSSDDSYMSFTSDTAFGYISSDRTKGCCYELFNFRLGKLFAYGRVLTFGNSKPFPGATILLQDSLGAATIDSTTTDANGKYYFRKLNMNRDYKVVAKADGYFDGNATFSTKNKDINDSVPVPDIELLTSKVGQSLVLDNIYYDFNKATLRPESMFTLDKLATELKKRPNLVVEISSHTDSKGSDKYNLDLSQRRAQSVVDYLISVGIPKGNIVAKGYGETQPIKPNNNPDGSDNPENRQINRRSEFKILSDGNTMMKSDGKFYEVK